MLRIHNASQSIVLLCLHKGKLQGATQQGALYDAMVATSALLVYLSRSFFPDVIDNLST